LEQRSYFIDHLRVVLTALVIAHHSAITYGASGGWFYREIQTSDSVDSLLMTMFCAVNQSFFMGMFFLIAGYYTPPSLARKGPAKFVTDRLLRLGIPWLVFGFVLGPMTVALAGIASGRDFWTTWTGLMMQGKFFSGPLWFAQALLMFAAVYVVLSPLLRRVPERSERPLPAGRWWLLAALLVGLIALLLRQWVPVGSEAWGLQVGYFSSYVFLFALGCAASRPRWLERITAAVAKPWMIVSLVTIPLLPLALKFGGTPVKVETGWTFAAILYAFWEPFVAWGIIAGLLWLTRERFNRRHPFWQALGERAYGAYILHAPVIVLLAVLLRGWQAAPLLKFVIVAVAGIGVSFALAGALLRLPGARRVL